jgi:hypothetical protein
MFYMASYKLTGVKSRCALASCALVGIFCASTALLPAHAADPANPSALVPRLMQEPGVGWIAYIPRGGPPDQADYEHARTFNEYSQPLSGLGPISDDPAHPFYNNAVARVIGKQPSYRVADLGNSAAKNLMPWALEALKKQNALVLAGKNGETPQARCWMTGVPEIHEGPWELYFFQTPKEVVMYLGGRGQQVRRVYLNVPHSKNPKPSWYGESVGHYESGDTLVVDTIGLNDKTFVDGYRTPHTTQLHVVERFRITDGGKTLDVSFTVEDPGTFYKPWSARRPRYRVESPLVEDQCAENNDDKFHLGLDPVPTAEKPDF